MARTKKEEVRFNLRLPPELHKQMEGIADKNRRSLNNELILMVEWFLAQQEDEKRGSITPDTNQKPESTSINKVENRLCP